MMQSIRRIRGHEVAARDGAVGSLADVYFDVGDWAVRYMVVDTGGWLSGRRVLVPPGAVAAELSRGRKVRLALLREQVERAPAAESDAHLRSAAEVIGYAIEARDGAIGEVQDFVIDDDAWAIHDVVVDTRRWWPGGHVHVHPEYVESIDWDARKVHVRLTREQVKLSGARTPRR